MGYFKTIGVDLKNELKFIRKKKDTPLQPLYEAVTNSLEAIAEYFGDSNISNGEIIISMEYAKRDLQIDPPVYDFAAIRVKDNGTGFDDSGIERLQSLRNADKGRQNKGTGRVQYVHYFKETEITSICIDVKNECSTKLSAKLSKEPMFLSQNSILWFEREEVEFVEDVHGSEVCFRRPIDDKDIKYYESLKLEELQQEIIKHFLAYFCDQRDNLPNIILKRVVGEDCEDQVAIDKTNIPAPSQDDNIQVKYSRIGDENKVLDIERCEEFRLRGFSLDACVLPKNEILLVSKGQSGSSMPLQDLGATDVVGNNRYLFLLSGAYLDAHDSDDRGNFHLLTEQDFKSKERELDEVEVVLLDRIESVANSKVREKFPEISARREEKEKSVEELAAIFLLRKETIDRVRGRIRNTDSDEQILKKIYEADVAVSAQNDAEIKRIMDDLNGLDPTTETYQEEIAKQSARLTTLVPLQNRNILSQYVARRKIVLDVFQKVLARELALFKESGRIDEDVLHNLIFRQHSEDPSESDLWLMNEEFIYFNGASEIKLLDLEYKGEKLLRNAFTAEESKYLESNRSKRLEKRPDILLFPEEGKCLLIEFKAPDIDVSKHLMQIDYYASLLLNFSKEKFKFDKFYGYLVGESIEPNDVRGHDSSYVEAATFDYLFRAGHPVAGFFGHKDGTLYTEVIKYSSLLKRARQRNKVFVDKLGLDPAGP